MARSRVIEEWEANNGDKPSCKRCAALNGKRFFQGEGPQPPLHRDCQCRRRVVYGGEKERKQKA
jgi:hypothetical protein